MGNKNIIKKYKKYHKNSIKAYDLVMCRYFCIRFIDFMLKGKSLLDYTNLFSPTSMKRMVK